MLRPSYRLYLLWVSAFAMLLSFLPLLLPDDLWSSEDLEEFHMTLHRSEWVFGAFAFSLGVCASVLVDCLAELLRTRRISLESLLRQLFVLASVAVPSLVYFINRSSPRCAKLMMCFLVCQRVAISAPFVLQLSESPSGCFRGFQMILLTLLAVAYPLFLPYWSTDTTQGIVFIGITFAMMAAIFSLLILMTCNFVKYLVAKGGLPSEEYHTLIFFIPITFASTAVIYSFAKLETVYNFSEDTLVTFAVCLSVMCVVAIQQPLRTAQSNQLATVISLLDMKKFFVRYISHEIRTPLNVATVGLSMMGDVMKLLPVADREGSEQLLSQVTEAVETAIDILNDILTYDKITSNLMVLEKTVLNPIVLVSETLNMFLLQAEKKEIQFLWSCQPHEMAALAGRCVHADVHKIKQVVRNFASNALKFTPKGGTVEATISLVERVAAAASTRSRGSSAIISPSKEFFRFELKDSGAGIAPENLPRVFREIVQFDANKLQEGKGTGMGLYISRTIVEFHGGHIGVASEGIGRGCTFSFELPLLPRDSEPPSCSIVPVRKLSGAEELWERAFRQDRHQRESFRQTDQLIDGFSGRAVGASPAPASDEENNSLPDPPVCPMDQVEPWKSARGLVQLVASGQLSARSEVALPPQEDILMSQHALLVDDSTASAKIVQMLLRKLGVTSELAENGAVAVDRVSQNVSKFDFIFMDYCMPVMDGPAAVVAIRRLGYRRPIFGLTGNATGEDLRYFMEAGADYVFTKPIRVQTFKDTLTEQLKANGGLKTRDPSYA